MGSFGDAERHIASLLSRENSFVLQQRKYMIIKSGKPTCYRGEPKTDIYVFATADNIEFIELKISFKKENADFIENKTNSERAEALLGENWKQIIVNATSSLSNAFYNKKLIYKIKGGRTEEGAITLGWKFELLNKPGGELSGIMDLSREQIIDVYAGTNLPDDKRNAMVNGEITQN